MSNKPKTGSTGHYSLARYRKEATGEPFVLDVDAERTITVDRPTGNMMFKAEAAGRRGDSKQVIRELCGDAADDILDLVGDEDFEVLKQLSEDLQKHFGLGE